jgi:methionine biosynthesis protein MetW
MRNLGTLGRQKALLNGRLPATYRRIVELIPTGAKVLDLGCGDGWFLGFLKKYRQVKARGIEISEEGVRKCFERGLSVYQGDIDEGLMDYPDLSFDVVLLLDTLPLLKRPDVVLYEMVRVGRMAIVTFSNAGYLPIRFEFLLKGKLRFSMDYGKDWWNASVIHPVTFRQFEGLLARSDILVLEKHAFIQNRAVRLPGVLANLLGQEGLFAMAKTP